MVCPGGFPRAFIPHFPSPSLLPLLFFNWLLSFARCSFFHVKLVATPPWSSLDVLKVTLSECVCDDVFRIKHSTSCALPPPYSLTILPFSFISRDPIGKGSLLLRRSEYLEKLHGLLLNTLAPTLSYFVCAPGFACFLDCFTPSLLPHLLTFLHCFA